MDPMITRVGIILLFLLMATGWTCAEPGPTQYQIQTRVWMDGELRGEPSLLVEADTSARIENRSGGQAWAMNVRVEVADEYENAMDGAIWLELSIEEEVDGNWQFLANTMLGLPPGRTGSISVVDEGIETATHENAVLFVEVAVEPVNDTD